MQTTRQGYPRFAPQKLVRAPHGPRPPRRRDLEKLNRQTVVHKKAPFTLAPCLITVHGKPSIAHNLMQYISTANAV